MPEREAVDLRWLLAVIRRWLWMIILCTILGLGGAYGINRYMPPVYTASSTLLVQAAVTDFQAVMTSERLAATYSQLLKESTVLEMVIQQLGLRESPAALASKLTVNPIPDTQLIRVSVVHTNAALAAQIANALTETFAQQVEVFQTERYSESLASIKEQVDELGNLLDVTQAKIDVLGTPRFPEDQAELARLEGLQAQYRSAYTALLQGYEQMRLSAAASSQSVFIAERARTPTKPTQHLPLYMALAGLVGMMVGTGASFLLEYMDDTIRTTEDVHRALGLKTLGTIGALSRGQRRVLVATELASPHGEAYRVLGANVCFGDAEAPLHTLQITSPTAMEGKSLTAANLAAALAQSGVSVALVEADMRRPTLGKYFDLDPHKEGLSTALARGQLDGMVRSTTIEGLSMLDSGDPPANPTRLLGSQHMGDLLHDLAHRHDVVVVDSPPVLPVADATLMARHMDGVLLVLRAGQTRWQAARQALDRLHQAGANVVGVVLNGVPTRHSGYYGNYYYSGYTSSKGSGRKTKGPSLEADTHHKDISSPRTVFKFPLPRPGQKAHASTRPSTNAPAEKTGALLQASETMSPQEGVHPAPSAESGIE
jgi:capsular exopolysaccharide synthesis family protein